MNELKTALNGAQVHQTRTRYTVSDELIIVLETININRFELLDYLLVLLLKIKQIRYVMHYKLIIPFRAVL